MAFRLLTNWLVFPIVDFKGDNLKVGDICLINIKGKDRIGIVLEIPSNPYLGELKEAIFTGLSVSKNFLNFLLESSKYNFLPNSLLIKQFLIPKKKTFISKQKSIDYKLPIINLNAPQQEVYLNIQKYQKNLIYGVTGCGKTEIYFQLIKDVLKENGQVLFLAPEIALAESLKSRFIKYFGFTPEIWYSGYKKKESFIKIINGLSPVVIGVKSSIFLPFKNLQLIIVDEEHSLSYGKEYNARDEAIRRSNIENIKLVLGSATPSLYTFYNKDIIVHKINERFNNFKPPIVNIVKDNNLFSKYFLKRANEELNKNNQIIVYLNTRGYSNKVICNFCKIELICHKCEKPLIFHKFKLELLCHKCDLNWEFKCFKCKNNNFTTKGLGVEKIKEFLSNYFKEKKIEIFSSDFCNSLDKINKFRDDVSEKKIDIIVGTQLISKGHDFPNISLILILNLNSRSYQFNDNEIFLQNLIQLIGRAGRSDISSEIIIQTDEKISTNYDKFCQQELIFREKNQLPPFYKIIFFKAVFKKLNEFRDGLKNLNPSEIFEVDKESFFFIKLSTKEFNKYIHNIIIDKKIIIQIDTI